MANKLITPAYFVKAIKEAAHNAAVNNGLSKKDENRLLLAVCSSIGHGVQNVR